MTGNLTIRKNYARASILGRLPPNEHGGTLAVPENQLADPVSGLPPSSEKVLFIEQLMSQFPFSGTLRDVDLESCRFLVVCDKAGCCGGRFH
jgi:hypothetical protein